MNQNSPQKCEFDDIRPYKDCEIAEAIERILLQPGISQSLKYFVDDKTVSQIMLSLKNIRTVSDFQENIMRVIIAGLLLKNKVSLVSYGAEILKKNKGYLFISNHRDIVLDPSFLNYLLLTNNHKTTQIAIGNNLLIEPWITDLVKINRSFIVKRNISGRELFTASSILSKYIRTQICNENQSVWIAQREGRAKDGDDRTQSSLIKMLGMSADKKSSTAGFNELSIVPVSISYEYDSCDVLKAKELYLHETGTTYQKTPDDDLLSMQFGIIGLTGRVAYFFGKPLQFDNEVPAQLNSDEICKRIDNSIHRNYILFPSHYISFDIYYNSSEFSDNYSQEDKAYFLHLIRTKIRNLLPEFANNREFEMQVFKQYASIVKNNIDAVSSET